jgi:hypothetical protein
MAIARVSSRRRIGTMGLFINTVHDSILLDSQPEACYNICSILDQVFIGIPANFQRQFGVGFNLPMRSKIKYGPNWLNMQEWKK